MALNNVIIAAPNTQQSFTAHPEDETLGLFSEIEFLQAEITSHSLEETVSVNGFHKVSLHHYLSA